MRLIDADALKEKAREWIPPYDASVVMNLFDLIDNLADNMPTIEPVRCGECKYKPTDTGGHNYGQDLEFPIDYKCPCQCGDQWYSWMPSDDWFCANGERKTDE